MPISSILTAEFLIKAIFLLLTCIYDVVTYRDALNPSPKDPTRTEWDTCWPLATWYISWHTAICLSVVSLPSHIFRLDVDLPGHKLPQCPDWRRLSILFLWYLSGIPTAYVMHEPCSVGAPGVWARAGRVFIEGVVAFGLAGLIHGIGRCLFPFHHSFPVLPVPPEKVFPGDLKSESV